MSLDTEIGACTVAEVMGTELFTLTPGTAVGSARRLVIEKGISHVLVLENETLAGIVCGDDLRHADRDAPVGDFMTSPVLCVTPDTTLQEAVDIMGANDIDCLPVVAGRTLVGMITLAALAPANLSPTSEPTDAPCGACAAQGGVETNGARSGISLCARCRKLIETNRRC